MTTVAFGIGFGSGSPLPRRDDAEKFRDLVRMAEDAGAEAIGTYDTAFIGGDAFVRATLGGGDLDSQVRTMRLLAAEIMPRFVC